MRLAAPILALILLESAGLTGAEVVYRETFTEGKTLADAGWNLFVDAGARVASAASAISGGDGDPRGLPPINAGQIAASNHKRGLAYVKEGGELAPFLVYTSEHPPLQQPLTAIRWSMVLRHADARVHVVVQIDGDGNRKPDAKDPWFVALDGVADPTPDAKGLRDVAVDVAGTTWMRFEFKAGGGRGNGNLPKTLEGAQRVAALPAGAVVSIGLWSPARHGRPNLDSIEVLAAGVLERPLSANERARRLLDGYAAEARTAATIEERWPALTVHLRQQGVRRDAPAWTPVLDAVAHGAVRYVHPDLGDDANDGATPGKALRSLDKAIRGLQAGDMVVLGPGVFYTPGVVLKGAAGTEERPIHLRAEPRGAATISSAWPDAAEGLVPWKSEGEGLWSAPYPSRAGGTSQDRRAMGGFRSASGSAYFLFGMRSLEDLLSPAVPLTWDAYTPATPMPWPGYGFALEGGRCWLRTPGAEDPNGRPVIIGGYTNFENCLLSLDGSTHIVLDGIRFEGAGDKALRAYRNSPYTRIRNCIVEWCRIGFAPDDDALVEWCEYTYPGYKRFADDLKRLQVANGLHVLNPMFGFVKKYHGAGTEGHLTARAWTEPKEDRGVGSLRCEARFNYIHETFDGQSLGGWSDSRSHHNVFVYQYDNAVEFEAGAPSQSRNNRFDHNLVIAAQYGAISHQDATEQPMGPQWVERNVILGNFPSGYTGPGREKHGDCDSADDAWRPWVVSKFLAPNANAISYDHNLIWMQSGGLLWLKPETAESRSKMNWRNNVLIFEQGLSQSLQHPGTRNLANVWVGPRPEPEIQGVDGQHLAAIGDLHLAGIADLDFRPQAGSPLLDRGLPLECYAPVPDGRPDLGPFEAGEDPDRVGGVWPRPLERVFNTAPLQTLSRGDRVLLKRAAGG